jgi:IS30 family transposase
VARWEIARRATGHSQGQIVDAISIRERHSRFVILVKVPSKDTATVVAALSQQVRKLPASLRRSLT